MEQPIMIDDKEMVEFISNKLSEQGIRIMDENLILQILDLEIEFLKIKGVIEDIE